MKVLNLHNKNGKAIANQYIIKDSQNRRIYFQSYNTVVAMVERCGRSGEVYLIHGATDFSRTTSKYLYQFLQDYSLISDKYINKAGIATLIQRGEIQEVEEF